MYRLERNQVLLISIVIFFISSRVSYASDIKTITLIAGGDIEWSWMLKKTDVYLIEEPQNLFDLMIYRLKRKLNLDKNIYRLQVPYIASKKSKAFLQKNYEYFDDAGTAHYEKAIKYGLSFKNNEQRDRYPFQKIKDFLNTGDVVFANLETPLSDRARDSGAYMTPTSFSKALKWAGISVVSTANNHCLDAEGVGLLDTIDALDSVGVGSVGTGKNLSSARLPFIFRKNGITIAFLAYTVYVNGNGGNNRTAFALTNRSGVVPLDPFLIKEDIANVRNAVDFVIVSFHWGSHNRNHVSIAQRNFAYDIIDAGADIILGHGPHLVQGIEVYKKGVIVYSMGNFIFSHSHKVWGDNILVKASLSKNDIEKFEIIPIAGQGLDLKQPFLLYGTRAHNVLEEVKTLANTLNTSITIENDVGLVKLVAQNSHINLSLTRNYLIVILGVVGSVIGVAMLLAFVVGKFKLRVRSMSQES